MEDVIRFTDKLKAILRERNITIIQFSIDTGIDRANFFYRNIKRKRNRAYYMAIAYYLNMTVEDLVDGTDAMDEWYG